MGFLPPLLQLNITEISPRTWLDLAESLFTAAVGASLALVGVYLTNRHQQKTERRQRKWKQYEERDQAYRSVFVASSFVKNMLTIEHDAFLGTFAPLLAQSLASLPLVTTLIPQAIEHRNKTELELLHGTKELNSAMVSVTRCFHPDEEVDTLVMGVVGFKIHHPVPDQRDPENLRAWFQEQRKHIRKVYDDYDEKTGALLTLLRKRLNAEKQQLEYDK